MILMKNGKMFDSFEDVWNDLCGHLAMWIHCVLSNPEHAARLTGYKVVEEESCDTCAYNPPSSGDGKPCSMCDTSDPMLNCYQKKEANMDKQSTTSQVTQPEPVNCGSSKPLKDWMLGEVQEYCRERKSDCVKPDECPFYRNEHNELDRLCAVINMPYKWDLSEKPRFTEEEVVQAQAAKMLFGEAIIERYDEKRLFVRKGNAEYRLPNVLFETVRTGQSVKLSDIVGGNTVLDATERGDGGFGSSGR